MNASMSLRSRRHIAAAALALLAGSAFAQASAPAPASAPRGPGSGPAAGVQRMGPGGAQQGEMHKGMQEKQGRFGRTHDAAAMQKRFDAHMADLKKSLQLTPAQEGAWTEFSNAMRPPATLPQRPDRDALEKMTTPQRLDQMQTMRKQHQEQMDKREAATRAFYTRLTPEQQKRFDEQTGKMMRGHGERGGMGRMGGMGNHHEHGGHHG